MSQYGSEVPGDNIEFTASAIGDYTIFLQNNDKTSADDSEFVKHPDNTTTARKFAIRTNKNATLVSINGVSFTNPVTIIADKVHQELRNVPIVVKILLRTTATSTTVKVRWF